MTAQERQFETYSLDLDTLSLLVPGSCFVLGSFQDYALFVEWFSHQTQLSRCQIVMRDYEPHVLCLDLELRSDGLHVFVCDSTPDDPPNWKKYVQHPTDLPICLYMNAEHLQSDEVSCKIFALMHVRRLAKRPFCSFPRTFCHMTMERNGQNIQLFLLPPCSLPIELYRSCQSLKRIRQVSLERPTERARLESHVEKRLCMRGGKPANGSVAKKVEKYRREAAGREFDARALGWQLPLQAPISCLRQGTCLKLSVPRFAQPHEATEAAYSEDGFCWLHRQARIEQPRECWHDTRSLLKRLQRDGPVFWLLSDGDPRVQEKEKSVSICAEIEWWRQIYPLLSDPARMLDMGCVGLLSSELVRRALAEHLDEVSSTRK